LQIMVKRVSLTVALLALVVGWAAACSSGNETNVTAGATSGGGGEFPDAGVTTDAGADATVDAGEPDASEPDADASVPPDSGTPDAGPGACQSPFTVASDPAAEAKATTALQALSPTAALTWSPVRGTLSSIDMLVAPMPGCTGVTDAYEQLFDYLDASPDLFQIDRTEWHAGSVVPCSEILANGFTTLIIRRVTYGPYLLDNDVFSAVADVQNGSVIFRNFSGVYIPRPTPALIATLQACPDVADKDLETPLRASPFSYLKFAPVPAPACTANGTGSYTAKPTDTLKFDPTVTLMWDESAVLKIHRQRSATLFVAPANYTPVIQNSDANCQTEAGPNIGWIRTFDSVTGAILYDRSNPDPTCNVC
jgi:hypothetical protein